MGFDALWVMLDCNYFFGSLIVICYYCELRLNQLNQYVNLNLKRKQFNRINNQFSKVLAEYTEVINEINQFNKFVSKLIFCFLLCCSSTLVFLIYKMIYVKIEWIIYIVLIILSSHLGILVLIIVLTTISISSKFQRIKRNLIKLNYVKNLQTKNRIKLNCVIITI